MKNRIILLFLVVFNSVCFSQNINMPTTNTTYYVVDGKFYDNGGAAGNYGNSINSTLTLYPAISTMKVSIRFNSFVTESATCAQDYDRLFIHNGNSTAAPAMHPTTNTGGFWTGCAANAMTVPQTFTSTAADGSITIRFKSDGSAAAAGWDADIILTGSPCGGTFYDIGGSSANYLSNLNYTYTIPCPAGQYLSVNFTNFTTENATCAQDYDRFFLHDGNSTAAPALHPATNSGGFWTGCAANTMTTPQTFTSTAADGTLTFRFKSDGSTVASGWVATISCNSLTPCAGAPSAGTTSISSSSGPSGVNYTLSNTGATTGSGISYQWQSSTDGTTWSNIAGATGSSYVTSSPTYSSIIYYRLIVTCSNSGQSATSNVVSYTVTSWVQPSGTASATLTTCSGTYYDQGGSGSNYSNNQNSLLTICPSTPGQFIRVSFTSWGVEANFDYLSVFDGNSTTATMIVGSSFSATSPGTITATTNNTSGCLTFKFYSDNATTSSGWAANISCVATGSTPPSSYAAQDCYGAYVICSNANFNYASLGPGVYNDANLGLGNLGCLNNYANTPNGSAEHQSVWGIFSPSSSGTIGMTIDPSGSSTTDYDWAIWGPYTSAQCPPTGNPLRCSAAAAANSAGAMTGMGNGAVDTEEGSGGNGWVAPINVTAGQIYIMLLDNWNATSAPLTLSWQLSNGASLDCNPLPIELTDFAAHKKGKNNYLEWTTASEINNDFFTIEKSSDGFIFNDYTTLKGAGNSTTIKSYSIYDYSPYSGITYYRLKQTDFDGKYTYSSVKSVLNNIEDSFVGNIHPNPTNDNINFNFYAPIKGNILIQILDITGRVVSSENITLEEGQSILNAKMDNLSKGIYSLKVTFEKTGFTSVNKIVKN